MRKYTFEEVKQTIESEGYTLLDTTYVDCKTKMKTICPKGHQYEVRFDNWLSGRRCWTCGQNNSHNNQRYSIDQVSAICEEHGYKFTDTQYLGYHKPFKCVCKCGRETYKT